MKRILSALLTLGAAAPLCAQAQVSDDEVRIGLISDFTSVYQDIGQQAEIAAEMAIEDFGGEVNGKKIVLYTRDHKLDAETGMKHAKELKEQYNVDAFLDMVGTNVAVPIQGYAAKTNTLAIHTGSASSILTGKYCSPVGVHWTYDTHALAAGSAKTIVDNGGKKWFFVTVDYTFGKVLQADASAAVKEAGGEVLGSALHKFKGTNMTSQLLEAMNSGADVIALANAGDDTQATIRQAWELGITSSGEQQLVGLLMTHDVIRNVGLYVSGGVRFVTGWVWSMNEETRAWNERLKRRAGTEATMFSAGVYSAVKHYLKAIEATGTDETKQVIAKMRDMPVKDIFTQNGKLRRDGRMVHDMYLVEVKDPNEVEQPGDYYKVASVIPGEKAFKSMEAGNCSYIKGKGSGDGDGKQAGKGNEKKSS
ncbi:ABC transporter substrate-binding protein [Ectothiorhodospiraceae bacterium WFHF3C12]|nr:ABC transporter substrate-binding protein [Ectothiorhodospiraceae bacterium WFHF3C12]